MTRLPPALPYSALYLLLLAGVSLINRPVAQAVVLAGVGGWWAARAVAGRGRMARPVPAPVVPLLGLLLMAGVGFVVSPDPLVSLPKLAGLVLDITIGAAAFQALHGSPARNTTQGARILAGLGGLLALAAPFTADFAGKVTQLLPNGWAARLPALLPGLTRDSFGNSQAGIHANELGGTLALLLPFALALALAEEQRPDATRNPPPVSRFTFHVSRFTFPAIVLLIGAALLLLGSRSGLLGAIVGGGVVVWGARPRWRAAYGLATGAVLLAGLAWTGLRADNPASVDTLSFRGELWARSLVMLGDAPFTGIGLNAYPLVQPTLYPILAHEATGFVAHAHNLALQTALDFGVPGLIAALAFVAALVLAARRALAAPGSGPPATRVNPLLLGALGALAAWGGHGLADAITLGAKPGVLVGLCAGIILAADPAPQPATRRGLARAVLAWVLVSLVGIGLLEALIALLGLG